MDIFALFEGRVTDALISSYPQLADNRELLGRVVVEPPRDTAHGDLSSNAAMVVAKPLGTNPREVANKLVEAFADDADVVSVEVAGPGFLNFRLEPKVWQDVIATVGQLRGDFGKSDVGQGEKVNVEYVSANPTGPMHVGHTRGAVYGDALASLLAYAGYDVTKEYYINDAGSQVDTLARSAFLRYREALGETIEIPSGLYPGDYLIPVGKALVEEFGNSLLDKPESTWMAPVRQHVLAAMLELIKADLKNSTSSMTSSFPKRRCTGRAETSI